MQISCGEYIDNQLLFKDIDRKAHSISVWWSVKWARLSSPLLPSALPLFWFGSRHHPWAWAIIYEVLDAKQTLHECSVSIVKAKPEMGPFPSCVNIASKKIISKNKLLAWEILTQNLRLVIAKAYFQVSFAAYTKKWIYCQFLMK